MWLHLFVVFSSPNCFISLKDAKNVETKVTLDIPQIYTTL